MSTYQKVTIIILIGLYTSNNAELSPYAREKGFVYLDEVAPAIRQSPRYATNHNFVGTPVDGYKVARIVVTRQTAEALKKVQEDVEKDGYDVVVYDGYRPQQGVNHFMRWSEDTQDQKQKQQYYRRVDKKDVFDLGYVAKRSGHSRGSTVDLTLIKKSKELKTAEEQERTLLDGFTIAILDDGTLDMGSSFDLFDVASHHDNTLIPDKYKKRREYLKTIMAKHGFTDYANEWWHFTLKNEPYSKENDESYFNFPIE